MTDKDIRAKVDEFVKWSKLADECKTELEKLKGDFQKLGTAELSDTKLKQVEFWGTENAKVVVTHSESVKVISHTFLSQTLGEILKDFAKEDITYKYTEPFKRTLAVICQGKYDEQSLDDVITQITGDEKTRKVLKKKLKGNWEKDIRTLMSLTGMSGQEAEHYAYFIQEIINYGRIVHLLEAAGHPENSEEFNKALKSIKHAVIVEEGVKVGIEVEETA